MLWATEDWSGRSRTHAVPPDDTSSSAEGTGRQAHTPVACMGVKGLHSYLEGKLPHASHTTTLAALADAAFAAGSACVVVVDGMSLIRKLYTPDLEWVVGGQYQELWAHVQRFVRAFEAHGLRMVVFIDGGVDEAKLSEWQSRRANDLKKVDRVVDSLRQGAEPPSAAWMPCARATAEPSTWPSQHTHITHVRARAHHLPSL